MTRCMFVLSILLSVLVGGCARTPSQRPAIEVFPHDAGAATIHYIGDVRDVIAGVVNDDGEVWRDADGFRIGFGAGSPESLDSLGEFLAVNGVAYAKSTDGTSPDYFETIHGPRFLSTCAVLIPSGAEPVATVRMERDGEPVTLGQLYEVLLEVAGDDAYCFEGFAEFSRLEALAVSRAPIYGDQLFENRDVYYSEGPSSETDVHTVIMGCAADFQAIADEARRGLLGHALYDNPYDESQTLSVHSHALLLSGRVDSLDQVTPAIVTDVNHLLSQSVIRSLEVRVYSVGQMAPPD